MSAESARPGHRGGCDFRRPRGSLGFVFVLGIVVVFLALAAPFDSFVHPLVIMLVGLAAKNGIQIVEFVNPLRDQGSEFTEALTEAAKTRLRPILMTAITTIAGTVPLLLAPGAGAETRVQIGTVVFSGVIVATLLTLFVVPVSYNLLCRNTGSPGDVSRRLDQEMEDAPERPLAQLVALPAAEQPAPDPGDAPELTRRSEPRPGKR